ncbi:uncharacterized protein LOC126704695 [Quercus robur]|uniref:uncharacterized protein LOC126704695 n=1 Tax=Quercus robur TaxID=38942 RepID=UPI002163B8EE|nr:uncharacterized protein LOC126704695 [Quercus robur]
MSNETVPVAILITVPVNHGEKSEKFNECSKTKENETNRQVVAVVEVWEHADFLCKNYILNGLDNTLYSVYSSIKRAKELWDSLDKKYKTEDARTKKFIVGRLLDYKMVDSKTVLSQVQELQVILHEANAEGMFVSESFQVATIIEKLPPSWKDFKNYLKHKRKEMRLEDLINKRKYSGESSNQGTSGGNFTKFNGKCYVCGKMGHRAKDFHKHKDQGTKKGSQANITEVENLSKDVNDIDLSTVISEVNFLGC